MRVTVRYFLLNRRFIGETLSRGDQSCLDRRVLLLNLLNGLLLNCSGIVVDLRQDPVLDNWLTVGIASLSRFGGILNRIHHFLLLLQYVASSATIDKHEQFSLWGVFRHLVSFNYLLSRNKRIAATDRLLFLWTVFVYQRRTTSSNADWLSSIGWWDVGLPSNLDDATPLLDVVIAIHDVVDSLRRGPLPVSLKWGKVIFITVSQATGGKILLSTCNRELDRLLLKSYTSTRGIDSCQSLNLLLLLGAK